MMQLVILAGGRGTRISEESFLRPKPLIEIGGKPIILHIMKVFLSSQRGINTDSLFLNKFDLKVIQFVLSLIHI